MNYKFLSAMGGDNPPKQPIFMLQPPAQQLPPGIQPPPFLQAQAAAEPPSEEIEVVRRRQAKPTVAPDDAIEIADSKGIKSGTFSKQKIQAAIQAARAVGIDPYSYMARVMQESSFGQAAVRRPGRGAVYSAWAGVHPENLEPRQVKEIDALAQKTGLDRKAIEGAVAMRDLIKYGREFAADHGYEPTDELLMQAHNGFGIITREKAKANKWHGIPIPDSGLNMAKTLLDGKRIVQLRNDLAKNEKIRAMVAAMSGQ